MRNNITDLSIRRRERHTVATLGHCRSYEALDRGAELTHRYIDGTSEAEGGNLDLKGTVVWFVRDLVVAF